MRRSIHPSGALRRGALALLTAAGLAAGPLVAVPARAAETAPGAPGAMSHFGLARKDCLGTARNTTSKVWFTVAGGVLSDVSYPTIDTTNVETMQFVVTDGSTFTDLQRRDMTYTVSALDESGMSCRVTSTPRPGSPRAGAYRLVTDYLTDPAGNAVVLRTGLESTASTRGGAGDLQLYVRLDPTVNGNGGGGDPATQNGGADDGVVDTSTGSPVPVASDVVTTTTAANRDYAQPVFTALRADRPFTAVTTGYAGTASDGLVQLDADRRLATTHTSSPQGNVVQTAQVALDNQGRATLALGFGADRRTALDTAGGSLRRDFRAVQAAYTNGWRAYDRGLRTPSWPASVPADRRAELTRTYWVSANTLKASEDKTFPGAIAASLASPWGQAVAAGDRSLTYFGSYREIFARDLYETFTGLLATGDVATAQDTVRFLFLRQQLPDGSFPRNSLPNGKTAPDSFGVQLDEVAYPILMARTVQLLGADFVDGDFYTDRVKRAADYLVAHGPAFGNERWEEQSGYSPSTIAAEIAGLVAAGALAERNGDAAGARVYRATADHYQRSIKDWTVTTTATDAAGTTLPPHFIRLSKNGDPDAATTYNLGNGGPDADQRQVLDAGFLELTRLGILPPDDADVLRTLPLVDAVLARDTDSGTSFYRYGTATPGTEDGYGDCHVPDATNCGPEGKPWAGACDGQSNNNGSGHLWPALAAERGEHDLEVGDAASAAARLASMSAMASGVGLVPEQAWENADLPASPWGTPPECASIGFTNGEAAGSASPLTWSAASYVRLARNIVAGRVTEQPADTTARYLEATQGAIALTLTAPQEASLVTTGTVTVRGTTAPGARVDVDAVNTDTDGAAALTSTTAGADGAFTVEAAVPAGTVVLTVTATDAAGATGFAQRTVVRDAPPGTLLFAASDPDGDDTGPGTYAYPTASDFVDGAYDLQAFEVYDAGPDTVTFRVRTRDLTPTFGSALGAQLLDIYVQNPAGGATTTAASFPQRNYTIAPEAAWNRLIEVQGFGQRFVDAAGTTVGPVTIQGNAVTRYITATVSKAALGGTPGSGWRFTVVLHGQDGFSPDQARSFATAPQPYQFGVCAAGGTGPICDVDPTTVPKAMDVLTPAGVSQADELDPTTPPVVVAGVTVP